MWIDDVIDSDSRYLQTLANKHERPGALLELDRETVRQVGDTWFITTHIGEALEIENPDSRFEDGDYYSVRAEFTGEGSIRLIDWQWYSGVRIIASYIGLTAIAVWFILLFRTYREGRKSSTASG